jgi:hypothetical protein
MTPYQREELYNYSPRRVRAEMDGYPNGYPIDKKKEEE